MPLTKLNTQSATSLDATKLTGNLPAISGASLTGIASDYVKIQTQTISSSVGYVDFTSGIDDTYTYYHMHFSGIKGNNYMGLRVGTASSYTSYYTSSHYHTTEWGHGYGALNTPSYDHGSHNQFYIFNRRHCGTQTHASQNGEIYFYNLRKTTGHKHWKFVGSTQGNGDGETIYQLGAGKVNDSGLSGEKVDRIRIIANTANFTAGTITLYGVKA